MRHSRSTVNIYEIRDRQLTRKTKHLKCTSLFDCPKTINKLFKNLRRFMSLIIKTFVTKFKVLCKNAKDYRSMSTNETDNFPWTSRHFVSTLMQQLTSL